MEVEGRRRRGRPCRRWLDFLKEDLEEKQLRVQDAAALESHDCKRRPCMKLEKQGQGQKKKNLYIAVT